MARQPQRDTQGRWSLRQIATEARITLRAATRIADLGWIDATNLGYRDIAVARVAVALLDAPRSPGVARETAPTVHATRANQALTIARDLASATEPGKAADEWLIITTDTATHGAPLAVANAVAQHSDPILLLPVGSWIAEAHRIAHTPKAAS